MTDHLSTLTLHRLRYGELAGGELAVAQAHLDTCGQCAARLEAQHKERAAFVLEPIPPAIREAARRRRGFIGRWWPALPLLLAAAAALLFVVPPPAEGPDVVRMRGEAAALEVWVDVGEGPRPYREHEALGAGDQVQLKYRPEGATHAAVAGRDHTGRIEVYRIFDTPQSEGLVDTPFGLTLDDASGTQELYVILGDSPFDSAIVEDAVARHPEPTPGIRLLRADVPKESTTP